jgi:hypothetical protein
MMIAMAGSHCMPGMLEMVGDSTKWNTKKYMRNGLRRKGDAILIARNHAV